MPCAAPPSAETQDPPPPSSLWPVLCSAILVGVMVGIEITRLYRARDALAHRRATPNSDEPRAVQQASVREWRPAHHAKTPWQIPWRHWKQILWRTYEEVGEHRLLAVAAGVVFYGLLAVFPALTALVSLYGLFASPSAISGHLSLASGILPQGAVDILRAQIDHLTSGGSAKLGFGFIFGLAVALWSANAGMKAIMDALNVVNGEKEKRSFIKLNLVALAFTLAGIGSLLVALGAVVILPIALNYLGLQTATGLILRLVRWPLLLVLIIVGLAALYCYGPSRREPRWQWISVGGVFAATAWIASSALLSWYLSRFANYNATYGSLGAGIGMMMWMWISSIMILLGAQLNSEIEHQSDCHRPRA
jgi:membrane protein